MTEGCEEGVAPRSRVMRAAVGAALGLALALGSAAPALAIPAYNQPVRVAQPDGSTASITTHGDEWFHYATNSAGVVVQRDPDSGTWRQVVGSGSGLALGSDAQAAADAGAIDADALSGDAARAAYYQLGGHTYSGKTGSDATASQPITVSDVRKTQGTTAPTAPKKLMRSAAPKASTSLPLLTIVVGFKDEPYRDDYDWNKTFFTGEYSVSSLYATSSEGKFTWRPVEESSAYGNGGNTNSADRANDGVVHVTLDRDYGNPDPFTPGDADYIADMQEAVKAAAQYVDFSQYDTDGDGKVEANELGLGVVFAGYEAATSSIPEGHHGIWSHQYSFTEETGAPYEVTCANGKTVGVDRYIVQSESESMAAGEEHQSGIGALGHELGHFLGMPDLYSTTYDSGAWDNYSTMYLSIMDYGSYGKTTSGEYRPTFFDPYDRYLLGYVTPEEITKSGTYTATSETDPAGYKCYIIHVSDDEYYLIENRQYASFDAGMEPMYMNGDNTIKNPTGGIVVWHVDNGIATKCGYPGMPGVEAGLANTVNVKTHRPGVMENYFEGSAGSPNLYAPFLNATEHAAYGASKLSLYKGSDDPAAKTDTGISVYSTDEGSTSMKFVVSFPMSITKQPVGAEYKVGDAATPLSVEVANATGSVTFKWEKSTDGKTWAGARPAAKASATAAKARAAADGATLVPDTSHAGTTQYRVTVTDEGGHTLTSDAATVKVTSSLEVVAPKDVTYDGKEQRQRVTVKDAKTGDVLAEGTDYTLAYGGDLTNAGQVTVTATGKGNYEGAATASYQIKKAPLTVRTESATTTRNGKVLTAKGTISGLVNGESATLNVTGGQKEVGTSQNTATIVWDGTAKESNYDVTYDLGTLTVRSADEPAPSASGKTPSAPAGRATSVVSRAASAVRSVLPKTGDANSAAMPVALGTLGALAVALGLVRRHRERRG